MTIVDKVKEVIKEDFKNAPCGIFGCRNIVGDRMCNLFDEDGVCVDICFDYEYFEVIGLSDEDYYEVERYYESLFEK